MAKLNSPENRYNLELCQAKADCFKPIPDWRSRRYMFDFINSDGKFGQCWDYIRENGERYTQEPRGERYVVLEMNTKKANRFYHAESSVVHRLLKEKFFPAEGAK